MRLTSATLTDAQAKYILAEFEVSDATPVAHSSVWSRRSYAPMYIYQSQLDSVRTELETNFPEYTIAFDVIFENRGSDVDWHCDYESLGPFDLPDRWRSLKESHFLSMHFNLTPDGGHLITLPWLRVSYLHYLCISTFGIFSLAHTFVVWITWPFLFIFATTHPNTPLVGNVFDNTRLHKVSKGAPRISYVVRMVKKEAVSITPDSVMTGIRRSSACEVFRRLLPAFDQGETRLYAGQVDWVSYFCKD
jgi:hypothetical protein